jgi:hypothetical protein
MPSSLRLLAAATLVLIVTVPAPAAAQSGTASPSRPDDSRIWITLGGGFTSLKGDCATCDTSNPVYNKTGSLVLDFGARANKQLDAAVEVQWTPASTLNGEDIRSTFVMGIGQYRPLRNHGFFVKGGMGIAFVRNWIYDATNDVTPPFTTNAMALMYGGGWEFRSSTRFGIQVFGMHNVVAMGDLTVSSGDSIQNVVGNFWTVGASVVIR